MKRIAFVCLGNICRSPMAEQITHRLLEEAGRAEEVSVESFGTAGYHVGEPADPGTDAALARGGWPGRGHRARRLGRADLTGLDLILCADEQNLKDVISLAGGPDPDRIRLLRSYDPTAPEGAAVPDPWGRDGAGFDECLEIVERACRGLVASLGPVTSPDR
ncbi:MAG: low molecular weight phosphotyrosine protein phosphatase [Actinomycetota bacterium]|nr:low molecular weight phosphotyrosine protein phosphatase [Actinomycetota bacterium]